MTEEGIKSKKVAPGLLFGLGVTYCILWAFPSLGRAEPEPKNEAATLTISDHVKDLIRNDYSGYLKTYAEEEAKRLKEWKKANEIETIKLIPSASAAPAESTGVALPRAARTQYVPERKLTSDEYFMERSLQYRILRAMRKIEIEQLLFERRRKISKAELHQNRNFSRDTTLPKRLEETLVAAFDPKTFPDLHDRYVKPLTTHQPETHPVKGFVDGELETIIRASLEAWEMDREIYRANVLLRRDVMRKFCRETHSIDAFAGEWHCPPEARKPENRLKIWGEQAQLDAMRAVWMDQKVDHFRDRQYLETPAFPKEWDLYGIDSNLLSLTRLEANHPDGVYLESSNGKYTPIAAYQLIAYAVIEDGPAAKASPKAALKTLRDYNLWIIENLFSIDAESFRLDSLSHTAKWKIAEILKRTFEIGLKNNQAAIEYLCDLNDTSFMGKYANGVKEAFVPAGSMLNPRISTVWAAKVAKDRWLKEVTPDRFKQEPKDLSETILKFSELAIHFLYSEGVQKLLLTSYGLDISDPRIVSGFEALFRQRQEQIRAEQQSRAITLFFVGLGSVAIMPFVAASSTANLLMTIAQSAIGYASFYGGAQTPVSLSGLRDALYFQTGHQPLHITRKEADYYARLKQQELEGLAIYVGLTAVEFSLVPVMRSWLNGWRAETSAEKGSVHLAKGITRVTEGAPNARKVNREYMIKGLSRRLMIKGERLEDVMESTIREVGGEGKDVSALQARLNAYHVELNDRWESLRDILHAEVKGGNPLKGKVAAQANFEVRNTSGDWLKEGPRGMYIREYHDFATWLRTQAVEVENAVKQFTNGNVSARAMSASFIENINAAESLMLRVINKPFFDERGLFALAGERNAILKSAAPEHDWFKTKTWADDQKVTENLRKLRFDDAKSTGAEKTADFIEKKAGWASRWLKSDNGQGAQVGVNSRTAKFARRTAKFLTVDYKWVRKLDNFLLSQYQNKGVRPPATFYTRSVMQGANINVLGAILGDRAPRFFHGIADGKPASTALTEDLDRTIVNFSTGFLINIFSTNVSMANLTAFERAIGTVGTSQPALLLSLTLNGVRTGNLFDNSCLNETVKRIAFENGAYKVLLSSVRRRGSQVLQSAFMRLGSMDGWRTGMAVTVTKTTEHAFVAPASWFWIGEKGFHASGVCDREEREILDDIEIFVPGDPEGPDPVIEIAKKTGTFDILMDANRKLRQQNPQRIEDLMP